MLLKFAKNITFGQYI